MDNLDWLGIRFYYNGQFEKSGKCLSYVGGYVELTFIQRDSVTLASVREQLADIKMAYHGEDLSDNHRLYWLFPGKNIRDGLRRLDIDGNVYFMEKCITDGGVVDVYVNFEENDAEDGQDNGFDSGEEKEENNAGSEEEKSQENTDSDWKDEHEDCSGEDDLEHCSDEDGDEPENEDAAELPDIAENVQPQTGTVPELDVAQDELSDECEDLDWCPRDEDSSGEDDEAEELRKHAKEVLRKIRMKLPLDEEKEVKESTAQIIPIDEMEEGNDTPYMDSSEEYSYDVDEYGNSVRS